MPIALTAFNNAAAVKMGQDAGARGEFSLAVRLGGRPRTLRRMENEAFFAIREHTARVERLEDEADGLWSELVNLGHSEGRESIASARIAVLPSDIAHAIGALAGNGEPAIVAQPGYGMMSAHWFDADNEFYPAIRSSRDAIHRIGGTLILERAPLEVKEVLDVWDYTGESLQIMRNLKAQYDPNGILNPNRFTGGI